MKWLSRFLLSRVVIEDHQIKIRLRGDTWKAVPLTSIDGLDGYRLLGFRFVHLHTLGGERILLRGDLDHTREIVRRALVELARSIRQEIEGALHSSYPSAQVLDRAWLQCIADHEDQLRLLRSDLAADLCENEQDLARLLAIIKVMEGDEDARASFVSAHAETELAAFEEFFDKIESVPLTDEQRRACIVCDERQLLVAAAGSGKSSTLVAKIGYVLSKSWAKPSEILVLVYNKAAATELTERIRVRLANFDGFEKIQVKTFHGFGLDLIGSTRGVKPRLSSAATDDRSRLQLIRTLTNDALSSGEPSLVAAYRVLQLRLSSFEEVLTDVANSQSTDRLVTLKGEQVKSREEVKIANFLFSLGVPYEYERPYEVDVADAEHGQYQPDFYLPTISTYFEHFAIDRKGDAPPEFVGYLEKTEWRRQQHQLHGTKFFETRSADFEDRTVFDKILYHLKANGYDFKTMSVIDAALGEILIQDEISEALDRFISNRKLTGLGVVEMMNKLRPGQEWLADVLPLADFVFQAYNAFLRDRGEIDFTDMIVEAIAAYDQSPRYLGIRYLLVDEFQDMSRARADLILSLLRHNLGCKLFGVGDDWQSINGFSGSDVTLMTDFFGVFGTGTIQQLTQTFRSNQGIATVASEFVMENPTQLKKHVHAKESESDGVIEIQLFSNPAELQGILHSLGSALEVQQTESKPAKVFVLARYRSFLFSGDQSEFERDHSKALSAVRANAKVSCEWVCATMHGSKGLEADVAVLLGLVDPETNYRSFPSRFPAEDLACLPLLPKEEFADAEERRLMYVALTRARSKVVIPVPANGLSEFVQELLLHRRQVHVFHHGARVNACPFCGLGFLIGVGRAPQNIGCTNFNCRFGIREGGDPCPACESGKLQVKLGRRGYFVGCNQYPGCAQIDKELSRRLDSCHLPEHRTFEQPQGRPKILFAGGELEGVET